MSLKKLFLIVALKDMVTLILAVLVLSLSLVFASQAEARLIAPELPPVPSSTHQAVHLPTGCLASVVVDRGRVIRAAITDPECLPKGIRGRTVPGTRFDFRLTKPWVSR